MFKNSKKGWSIHLLNEYIYIHIHIHYMYHEF